MPNGILDDDRDPIRYDPQREADFARKRFHGFLLQQLSGEDMERITKAIFSIPELGLELDEAQDELFSLYERGQLDKIDQRWFRETFLDPDQSRSIS